MLIIVPFGGTVLADGQAQREPIACVQRLYQPYIVQGDVVDQDDFALISNYATWRLRVLISRDQDCERKTHGICRIDFDPVVGAQDYDFGGEEPDFIGRVTSSGETVTARFTNGGMKVEVYYDFVQENGRWRIDNIRGKEPGMAWNLRTILSQGF
jgi:hypothetical protein